MASDRSGGRSAASGITHLEYELTMHLERAHELGERMRQSNTAVEEQLRRTRQIAAALMGVATPDE